MESATRPTAARVFVLLLIMLAVFGLSYVFQPAARKAQKQMEEELKSLPLPPGTTEQSFSAGYQPLKGRASRTIFSVASAKDVCGFFSQTMTARGWRLLEQSCFIGDWGHVMMRFRKGQFTFELVYVHEDSATGMSTYLIASTWPS
jgi:hypothetical protein